MVMQDMPRPRETFVLARGSYEKPTVRVEPGVPASLPPLPAGATRDRLGLAAWLVSPTNPLTARVTVNRAWQQFFGAGLVRTPEDFGVQGQRPSHPELLDWLAGSSSARAGTSRPSTGGSPPARPIGSRRASPPRWPSATRRTACSPAARGSGCRPG
jgi:hypothetical protein